MTADITSLGHALCWESCFPREIALPKEFTQTVQKVKQVIAENILSGLFITKAAGKIVAVYKLFMRRAAPAQAAGTITVGTGIFLGASLLQIGLGLHATRRDVHKIAKAIQGHDLDGGIFYGLIHAPTKLALAAAGVVNFVQPIFSFATGSLLPVWGVAGAVVTLVRSIFVFFNGFYHHFHARTFSRELYQNIAQNTTEEWLLNQAFFRSDEELARIQSLPEAEQKEAFDLLLSQQRESFIRRTSAECYQKVAEHFFLYCKKDGTAQINMSDIDTLKSKKEPENLNTLLETIFQHNFQVKVCAAIKMLLACFALGATIALIVGSGGLGLIAATAIVFAIVLFLQVGLHAKHLQREITGWMWEHQKHRILDFNAIPSDPKARATPAQVRFFAISAFAALTYPVWVVPAAVYFQGRAAHQKIFSN